MSELTEILLSDGRPCQVRRLRIFELDSIKPPMTRPFLYKVRIGENLIERPYDISAWDTPPEPTDLSAERTKEGSIAWWSWFEYEMYYAAVYQEQRNKEDLERYCIEVRDYIMASCIDIDDHKRIVTTADYTAVYYAALVPQISYEDLEQALENTFRASFDGKAVLAKIFEDAESDEISDGAAYNAIRTWEVQAINASGLTEDDWTLLDIKERARRIVAMKIDEWMSLLSSKKREAEKKGVMV